MRRLEWKTRLLADIDAAETAPAQPLPASPGPFEKVYVDGTLRPDAALYGSEVRDTASGPIIGAYLIEPLDRPGAPTILVNRGWVPTNGAVPPVAAAAAHVEGYVRSADTPGLFSARDDPAGRRFFTLDPAAIGPALGVDRPAPFALVQLGTPQPSVYPQPATALPRPPNDHFSYALTWFGLAAVALVISVLQVRKTVRS